MKVLCLVMIFLAACSGTGRSPVGPADSTNGGGASDLRGTSDSGTDVRTNPDVPEPPPDGMSEDCRWAPDAADFLAADVQPGDPVGPGDTLPPLDILPDVAPDVPLDVPSDLPPLPGGCCYADSDCAPDANGQVAVCAGQSLGWPKGAGVCKAKPSEPGRCFGDAHCPKASHCDGEAVCGCNTDCDMDYEGPGICVPDNGSCVAIDEDWVLEYCNAASLVVFDGSKCVATCPGCCECKPFCKYTFSSIEQCEASCMSPPACPTYVAALQTEPFALAEPEGGCVLAMESVPCGGDADCPLVPFDLLGDVGDLCVLGNCVFCWNDTQCSANEVCRAGRCIDKAPKGCKPAPTCKAEDGCRLITPSEKPCPVCVCDSTYSIQCDKDETCMLYSFHPFSRCLYGRCADCRNDSDCPAPWSLGTKCIPPGICYDMAPPASTLYGTWLIGWYGGLDHFSYFRFEQDGTLRRGHYKMDDTFMDDFPGGPCYPGDEEQYPLLGTWEPEITQSGFLVIRLNLNMSCNPAAGFEGRWMFSPSADGQSADVKDIDSGNSFLALRYPTDTCLPDMSMCDAP